jgi:hypothetical protein
MVKIVRGQTRVPLLEHCWPFSSNQTEDVSIVAAFPLRKPVLDGGQIYKRNETNMCINISVTMNTAHLHICHHNFLKHTHAYYSFAHESVLWWGTQRFKWLENTGYNQKDGAVSNVNKKCISRLTLAQRTPSAAATVRVSRALTLILLMWRIG